MHYFFFPAGLNSVSRRIVESRRGFWVQELIMILDRVSLVEYLC